MLTFTKGQLSIHNRAEGGLEALISLPLLQAEAEENLTQGTLEKIKQTITVTLLTFDSINEQTVLFNDLTNWFLYY